MKIINFTCVEKLQCLLDKSCSQTIRPAWEEKILEKAFVCDGCGIKGELTGIYDKLAKFRVGEKVRVVWDKDSKYKYFMKNTQLPCVTEGLVPSKETRSLYFNKVLGVVKMVEVFKIQMHKYHVSVGAYNYSYSASEFLSGKDGFESGRAMGDWFNKHYDLSSSKEFFVYRWKWVREGDC